MPWRQVGSRLQPFATATNVIQIDHLDKSALLDLGQLSKVEYILDPAARGRMRRISAVTDTLSCTDFVVGLLGAAIHELDITMKVLIYLYFLCYSVDFVTLASPVFETATLEMDRMSLCSSFDIARRRGTGGPARRLRHRSGARRR